LVCEHGGKILFLKWNKDKFKREVIGVKIASSLLKIITPINQQAHSHGNKHWSNATERHALQHSLDAKIVHVGSVDGDDEILFRGFLRKQAIFSWLESMLNRRWTLE